MSTGALRFFKILIKALCMIVLGFSSYFLYLALTLPLTYPILNVIVVALLLMLVIFSIMALLT
ncbi:MAG: hypothetical protein LZ174_02045 [Thaumarchaeota archaeon]|nr:hypothetical protein [Candidatus Geocrenenecus arthurdayi]